MIVVKPTIPALRQDAIMYYLCLLGMITACCLLLALLILAAWLCQELVSALIELGHLLSTCNPLIIVALIIAAVFIVRMRKTR